jgi:hypothetical protein
MLILNLIPGAINEILVSVSDNGYLTKLDRYGLMAAIIDESLDPEERSSIDRLLRLVRRGMIKVVDN